jgi:hypothetical protein
MMLTVIKIPLIEILCKMVLEASLYLDFFVFIFLSLGIESDGKFVNCLK